MALVQSYDAVYNQDEPIGDSAGNEFATAMSFQIQSAADINKVVLPLRAGGGITSAITMRIETNAAGNKPSGTLAHANAQTSVTPNLDGSYHLTDFNFTPFALSINTRYWIRCSVPAQSNNVAYSWKRNGNGGSYYSLGGQSTSFNGGAWNDEYTTYDLHFYVYALDKFQILPKIINQSIHRSYYY